MGLSLGTSDCPKNLWQAITWFYSFLPGGKKIYMIGLAAVCWAIWIVRNKVTFDEHIVRSPSEVLFTMCSFLLYWLGLQVGNDRDALVGGTRKLMKMAADFAWRSQAQGGRVPAIIGDQSG